MTLAYGFFNSVGSDRLYDAEDFSRYLEGIITNGCFPNDTGFKALANSEPIGANPPSIIISAGKAYYDGMWVYNDQSYAYSLGSGQQITPGMKHLVYFCYDTNDAGREVTIECLTSATPELPANGSGKYYMPLALIEDQLNAQPEEAHITDQRLYAGASALSVSEQALPATVLQALTPTGAYIPFAGLVAPSGWLLCNGSAISRTTYADLFAVIGTAYGAGDGSTTFNVPNMNGRVPVGYDPSVSIFDTLGKTGGSRDAVVVSHTHAPSSQIPGGATSVQLPIGSGSWRTLGAQDTYASINAVGESGVNKNLPPFMASNYIIKY